MNTPCNGVVKIIRFETDAVRSCKYVAFKQCQRRAILQCGEIDWDPATRDSSSAVAFGGRMSELHGLRCVPQHSLPESTIYTIVAN